MLAYQGLALKNIDMNDLLDKKLVASEMVIDNVSAKIYRDLHKPLQQKSKVGSYPSQLLMQIGQPVNIASLTVNHAFVQYRENETVSDSTGVVKFANSTFNISNITNIPEAIQKNNELNIAFKSNALGVYSFKGKF